MPGIFYITAQEGTPDGTQCSPPLADCASSLKEGKISVAARQLILGWFNILCKRPPLNPLQKRGLVIVMLLTPPSEGCFSAGWNGEVYNHNPDGNWYWGGLVNFYSISMCDHAVVNCARVVSVYMCARCAVNVNPVADRMVHNLISPWKAEGLPWHVGTQGGSLHTLQSTLHTITCSQECIMKFTSLH